MPVYETQFLSLFTLRVNVFVSLHNSRIKFTNKSQYKYKLIQLIYNT